MKKYFYFVFGSLIFFACNPSNQVERVGIDELENRYPGFIWPKNISSSDTILNDGRYVTKLYLNNDSLIDLAIDNNVDNYLNVNFTYQDYKKDLIIKDKANVKDDTAYVDFIVNIPGLSKDSIAEYKWTYTFFLKWIDSNAEYDTAFIMVDKLYVKGNR